uniref:Uncharacterized protein n=1 Tax=Mesocestoides corti TaxID=53468 RepID=A0A5K3EYA7_MESCO
MKLGSQPEKDTNEEQHLLSGMASLEDSDERHLKWVLVCDWLLKPVLLHQISFY